jgi:hypothetical protein
MAITTNNMSDSAGIVNLATGQLASDAGAAAALTINVGFTPRRIRVIQLSGTGVPNTYEWLEGMPNSTCLLSVAAGTQSISTTLGPVVTDRTFALPAGVLTANGSWAWEAMG